MRPRKPEAEKKKPGLPPRRPFYNRIGFHISHDLHQNIKALAQARKMLLESIYHEALSQWLEIRANESMSFQYIRPPIRRLAKQVTVEMEEQLWQAIQHAAVDDKRRIADLFETAVHLYLSSDRAKQPSEDN